jgi:hypothetical protein
MILVSLQTYGLLTFHSRTNRPSAEPRERLSPAVCTAVGQTHANAAEEVPIGWDKRHAQERGLLLLLP